MCGRFNLLAEPAQLIEHFELQRLRRYDPSYNIAPGRKILTVVKLEDGSHKAVNLWWGLLPSWAKDKKISSHLINARAETVADKPSFRAAYRKRRCLIPATGFYEWRQMEQGKQAHHIYRQDRGLFSFAGLWEHWENSHETVYSCTIITTPANELMRPVHQRMPVILSKQHYRDWLNKEMPLENLSQLLVDDAYQGFMVSSVSDWVNNPAHDDPDCLT